jgi:hypothetical protein
VCKKQDSTISGEMCIWQSGITRNSLIHMKIFEKSSLGIDFCCRYHQPRMQFTQFSIFGTVAAFKVHFIIMQYVSGVNQYVHVCYHPTKETDA